MSPTPAVTTATQNAARSIRYSRSNSAGEIRPITATITIAARIASRQVLQDRAEEERHQDRQHGRGDAGELRPRARALVDRALREAARRGKALGEPAGQCGRAVGEQLAVAVDRGLGPLPLGPRDQHRLHERHHRDRQRAGEQAPMSPSIGAVGVGRPDGTSPIRRARGPRCRSGRRAGWRRPRRRAGRAPAGRPAQDEQDRDRDGRERDRRAVRVAELGHRVGELAEEALVLRVGRRPRGGSGSCETATVRPTPVLMPVIVAGLICSTSEPSRKSRIASRHRPTSMVRVNASRISSSALRSSGSAPAPMR